MYKRLVVKVGTKVITQDNGQLNTHIINQIVAQIYTLRLQGTEVILVSSGAVGVGRGALTLPKTTDSIAEKQVYAAVGQVGLMATYSTHFKQQNLHCAQVLVTKEDFRDKLHYFHMRNCLEGLLSNGIVPVINENDVVAVSELIFTDNDELTGLLAGMLAADAVIILTSVAGVLTGAPDDKNSKLISKISLPEMDTMQKYVQPQKSAFGRGGMLTKFGVAKKLALQGIPTHIADGSQPDILLDVCSGQNVGTTFIPSSKANTVKRRIAFSESWAKGAVRVNTCAEEILRSRETIASLLPVGIESLEGTFQKGDIVQISNEKGLPFGFGIAQYDSEKLSEVLGRKKVKPFIHYDYMFIH